MGQVKQLATLIQHRGYELEDIHVLIPKTSCGVAIKHKFYPYLVQRIDIFYSEYIIHCIFIYCSHI